MVTTAFIHMWKHRVGAIAWDANRRLGFFEYDPSFLHQGVDIAPLTMPISEAAGRIFSFPELRDTFTFKGLPGLLADVLPDKYGHALINAWLNKNGRASESMNPVELLCYLGRRGMGALEFEPATTASSDVSTSVELDSLVEVAQRILQGRQDFTASLTKDEDRALTDLLRIGTSAGGARAKAVIAYNPITREVRSGQTLAPKGFHQWLLKFDGVSDLQL